jgi:hypothetical protein
MNGVISPGQAEVTNQMPPHADAPRAPRQKWASYFERRYATPRAPRPRNHYGVRYNLEDDLGAIHLIFLSFRGLTH